jgi:protein TonB
MLSNISGFIISALVHIALATLVLNAAESPKPRPPKAKPVALTLAMFTPEPRLAPKPEKSIKKQLVQNKTAPVNEIKVAKAILKPAPKIQLNPKPVKRRKAVKRKTPKKLNVSKARLKTKIKPKKIKRLRPKPKPKKVKTWKQHRIQPRPPVRRVVKVVKRAIVQRPVRKVRRTSVLKRNAHQPVKRAVHRPVQRAVVPHKVSLKRRVPHPPHQRAVRKRIVKPVVRAVVKKSRVKAAPVKPRAATTTTQVSGQALKSYKARLRQLIETNKRYPKRAKRRGEQGTVIVSFVIFSNGQVKNIRISKSSGSSVLDNAAKKAVSKVSGKLPFTTAINKKQWQFTVPVVYRLR